MSIHPLLRDAFDHESWANGALLAFCEGLTPEVLRSSTPGAYGSVAETIRHHLDAAAWYQHRLGLDRLTWEEHDVATEDVAGLRGRAEEVAARWRRLLDDDVDTERVIPSEPNVQPAEHIRAGVYLAQVLNHGSEHRGQVCTILTTIGIDPPELDVWAYAYATGRVWTDEGSTA